MYFAGNSRRNFLKKTALAGGAAALPSVLQAREMDSKGQAPSSPVKICLFSKHLQWLDYDEAAAMMAEAGFDGADLTVRRGGHVLPERVEEDLPRFVEALKKAGVEPLLMTTNIKKAGQDKAEATLKAAAEAGIRAYRMSYYRYQKEQPIPGQLQEIARDFASVVALNKKYGIYGAYQNHSGYSFFGGPVWDLWEVLRELDPAHAGCQYDVRHATVEGGYAWELGLRLLTPWLYTTVIKDFVWDKNKQGKWYAKSVPLGKGMVDFEQYFSYVKENNISGPISLHYEYPITREPAKSLSKQERWQQTLATLKKDVQALRGMLVRHGL